MKLVVDASVFIAFVIPEEKEHLTAARFISACVTGGHRIIIPALAWPEITGNVARRKNDPAKAEIAFLRLSRLPRIKVILLDERFTIAAARIASRLQMRGADAIYAATARKEKATLVTLDSEMRERAVNLLPTQTPTEWLADYIR